MLTATFTHSADQRAETVVGKMLSAVVTKMREIILPTHMRALVLLGGYGKGEGGLIYQGGEYRPHNNFDFMLILSNRVGPKLSELADYVQLEILGLANDLGIGINISVTLEGAVRKMPTRVFTYDMFEGHVTLFGDDSIIPSMSRNPMDIPGWDVRNLMVNRGSLFLINQLCLWQLDGLNKSQLGLRKLIIKHTMQAIIGYGDAVLYYSGLYHWSYREKYNRISSIEPQFKGFARLYQEAINFIFTPCYDYYLGLDLALWQRKVGHILQAVHLNCERTRLGVAELQWHDYLEHALKALPREKGFGIKRTGKLLLNLTQRHAGVLPKGFSLKQSIGYGVSDDQSLLPVLFPLIAYCLLQGSLSVEYHRFIASHFPINDDSVRTIVSAYLMAWGRCYDANLWVVLAQNDIRLEAGVDA